MLKRLKARVDQLKARISPQRIRSSKRIIPLLIVALILVPFQNCGPVGDTAQLGESSNSSSGTPEEPPPPPVDNGDKVAPSAPTNVRGTPTSSQITVMWNASTDNVGVIGYKVYRGMTLVSANSTGTSFVNTGLNASTAYTYQVSAFDAAGNESAKSTAVTVTTMAPVVVQPPVNPSCVGNKLPTFVTTSLPDQNISIGMVREAGTVLGAGVTVVGNAGAGENQVLTLTPSTKFFPTGSSVASNMRPIDIDNLVTASGNDYSFKLTYQQRGGIQCVSGRLEVSLSLKDSCENGTSAQPFKYNINVADGCRPEVKVRASDAGYNENFGYKTAITNSYMASLANRDTQAGPKAGAVYMYMKSGSSWVFDGKVMPNDTGLTYGELNSIALDGTRLVVGAPYRDGVSAVYVFERAGAGSWNQVAKIYSPDNGADSQFGYSVALSGGTMIVGTPRDSEMGVEAGAAYVYQGSGASWTMAKKLLPAAGAARHIFGHSVSIEGTKVAVGAPVDTNFLDIAGMGSGSVYTFDISNVASPTVAIVNKAALGGTVLPDLKAQFGFSVSTSAGRVLVGAPGVNKAFVLASNNTLAKTYTGMADTQFGKSVALKGNDAVVGIPFHDTKMGAARFYDVSGTGTFLLMARDRLTNDNFGNAVSVNANGEAAIGSFIDDLIDTESGTGSPVVDAGSTYVITLP